MTTQEFQTDITYLRKKLFILMQEADKLNPGVKEGVGQLLLQAYDLLQAASQEIENRGPESSHNSGEIWK